MNLSPNCLSIKNNFNRSVSKRQKLNILLIILLFVMLGCGLPENLTPSGTSDKPTLEKPQPTAAATDAQINEPLAGKATPLFETLTVPVIAKKPLTSEGPWLLLEAQDGLYAANVDGSGLKQLVEQPVVAPVNLKAAVSPFGGYVAYVTASDPEHYQGLSLNLLRLSDQSVRVITPLTTKTTTPPLDLWEGNAAFTVGEPVYEAARAITMMENLAWSPAGNKLAFVGVLDGPSSDLYLYDLQSEEITRLGNEPSHAYQVSWSPDGRYIVNFGASTFGSGAGFSMVGAWATRPDGKEVKSLYVPDKESMGEELMGWTGESTFIVQQWSGCPARNLRMVDASSGEVRTLFDSCYNSMAFTPRGDVMLAVPADMQAYYGVKPGIYYFPMLAKSPELISDVDARLVTFSPELFQFFVLTGENDLLSFLGGQKAPPWIDTPDDFFDRGPFPVISPNASYWAKATSRGLMIRNGKDEAVQVSPDRAAYMVWGLPEQGAGSKTQTLFFSVENEAAGQLYIAASPKFVPALVPGSETLALEQPPLWVKP